jgi:hypothetical protein
MIRRCECGHIGLDESQDCCGECDSTMLTQITDPEELISLAQASANDRDRESMHRFADESLIQRMIQLDPKFAEKYKSVRENGFWYA